MLRLTVTNREPMILILCVVGSILIHVVLGGLILIPLFYLWRRLSDVSTAIIACALIMTAPAFGAFAIPLAAFAATQSIAGPLLPKTQSLNDPNRPTTRNR